MMKSKDKRDYMNQNNENGKKMNKIENVNKNDHINNEKNATFV